RRRPGWPVPRGRGRRPCRSASRRRAWGRSCPHCADPSHPCGGGRRPGAGARWSRRRRCFPMALSTSTIATMLPVTDTSRAQEFYSDRLALPLQGTDGEGGLRYQLGGGTMLVLLPREAGTQNPSTAISWEVTDLPAEMAE